MFEQMKWEDVYQLWNNVDWRLSKILSGPVDAECVHVPYLQDGYFFGYDWLQNGDADDRKKLIEERVEAFLCFTRPTNKGTRHTAEMLVEAEDEEERAAIWIAATAWELSEYSGKNQVGRYSDGLYVAARDFLKERFCLWSPQMKKLVPRLMIPRSVLENVVCNGAEPVMGLIQMNTALLKREWTILYYSSIADDKQPQSRCRRDKS